MRYLCVLLCSAVLVSCYSPERNCAHFKTGTFQFETVMATKVVKTTFVRNDSIEIDYFKGRADTATIRWINNCEYIVKKSNPKNQSEKKALHIKILTTHGNSYTFEYNEVGKARKERGTAVKVAGPR
ncbi:MAG: DNA topoisomerase IV [Marinirhabdus sp.]